MKKTVSGVTAIILAGAFVTACASSGDGPQEMTMSTSAISPSSAEIMENARCGADAVMNLIDQPQTAIPASVRARARVVADNQPVTQDFSPTRLNIVYSSTTNRVMTVKCG